MEKSYSKHYIVTDENRRVLDGWSESAYPERDAADAICITEFGGYPFRLFPDGEDNPILYTEEGIPLYQWNGQMVTKRPEADIQADIAAVRSAASNEQDTLKAQVAMLEKQLIQSQLALVELYEMTSGGAL